MLAKLTSKNQLTLPKAAVQAVGAADYFDVAVHEGQIVLTPVRIQRGDAVRAKLAALGLGETDMADAVAWARSGAVGRAAAVAAEPAAVYTAGVAPGDKPAARKKPARRA
ncbi:MAG: AbrB/MazE/SpoVT family DNA-binding domain-containing protein [Ideonella sp.]|nr:AbrB/MazE/SpoVT family DNA-binding domain-containing protein [Ideonella sp.]